MKKLHKNFNYTRETIESMQCDCYCWCITDCTTIYNYTGVADYRAVFNWAFNNSK